MGKVTQYTWWCINIIFIYDGLSHISIHLCIWMPLSYYVCRRWQSYIYQIHKYFFLLMNLSSQYIVYCLKVFSSIQLTWFNIQKSKLLDIFVNLNNTYLFFFQNSSANCIDELFELSSIICKVFSLETVP